MLDAADVVEVLEDGARVLRLLTGVLGFLESRRTAEPFQEKGPTRP